MAARSPRVRACPDAPKWTRGKETVAWSQGVAEEIVERVAGGEGLYAVLRGDGMPTSQSVGRWVKDKPEFGEALMLARVAGGRPAQGGGGVWTYCEATARAVFDRLCEGESLTSICADPMMPSMSTVFYWRRVFPEFAQTVRVAREIQAERFCELGWDLASGAEPQTAYLTHVRLTQLRWMAGTMAPRAYRAKLAEPVVVEAPLRILYRRFEIEVDAETGKRKVVAFCPNPDTGEAMREDAPGFKVPPDSQPLPG